MSDSIAYSDRALRKKLKPELQAIATAMGLDTAQQRVSDLITSIQGHMKARPEMADDPKFLPLFAHRSAPKAGGKTSADKAAEEAVVPPQPTTGANKTLLKRKIQTDPPALFEQLAPTSGPRSATSPEVKDDGDDSESDLSDGDSPPPTPIRDEKHELKAPKKARALQIPKHEIPGVVQVTFFDENDHSALPRQVPVLSDEIPITVVAAEDGSTHFKTSLSMLLPAAILNDSPIKERGGRIYRANIRAPTDASMVHDTSQFPLPSAERLKFTGSASDVPLAIATDRAINNPTGKLATPRAFLVFLHGVMRLNFPDLLEFGKRWPRAKAAGMLLDRFLMQENIFDLFTAWSRPTGGYTVPTGYENYTGVAFTKDNLIEAGGFGSFSSSSTATIFAPQMLAKAPKAKAWYESGGTTHDDFFRKMKTADFKKYLDADHHDRASRHTGSRSHGRRRSRSLSLGEGTSRKHLRKSSRSDSGEDSEDDRHRAKRSKRKAASVNSDNLDRE
ncbi:hypothetical protein B0H17DRAFT_1206339 [Mycena rosella]|uniref:Uncharacterized protein n=1 Tax=Mycena rosella TaxID=1033263 RepID=A0AAD7GBR6_MYCRO|nr:hypothetical protein B0H17DRAFT_1206339 [Mycena rosella]